MFPHRDINLTAIYGPKSLHENSSNQLRSLSTLGKHKAKNSYIEMGKKSHWISPTTAPPPSWHSSAQLGKMPNSYLFPKKGKRRMECMSNFPIFQGTALQTNFYLTRLRILERTWHTLDAWRRLTNNSWLGELPENLNYCI